MIGQTLSRLLAIGWTLLIIIGLSLPGSELPSVPVFEADKLIHLFLFFGFGWLWLHALNGRPGVRIALVLGAGVAFAVLSEIYQGLLPFERSPDPMDAVFDATGVLLAVLVYALQARSRSRRTEALTQR